MKMREMRGREGVEIGPETRTKLLTRWPRLARPWRAVGRAEDDNSREKNSIIFRKHSTAQGNLPRALPPLPLSTASSSSCSLVPPTPADPDPSSSARPVPVPCPAPDQRPKIRPASKKQCFSILPWRSRSVSRATGHTHLRRRYSRGPITLSNPRLLSRRQVPTTIPRHTATLMACL
jgi:hypothetical protein